jgi:hypothetical protein
MKHLRTPSALTALTLAVVLGGAWISAQTVAQPAGSGPEIGTAEGGGAVVIMPRSGPFAPETVAVPNARVIASWARSGHSKADSPAFTHWNEDGEIRAECATCHSGIGFRDYHGLDGSPAGPLDHPVQIGGVVDCDTCHNPGISQITEVSLPSGISHPVAAGDASCTTCHQGRSAGLTVVNAVGDKPADVPDPELRFVNPHYAVAAASTLGSYGGGGYHYDDKSYQGRYLHAKPVATCVSCHEPHSLEVAEATCLTCHESGDPAEIRIARVSYDGSGDITKGIKADIAARSDLLMRFMTEYAQQVAGTPILYNDARYPYFFADANGDGVIDEAEGRPVAYAAWTPRLLKATYNWKFVSADKGIHVHNPYYALQLLYDSVSDLAGPLGVEMDDLGLLR